MNFTGTSYVYGKIKNENTPLNNGKSIHLYGGTIGGTRYIGDIRIERYVSIKNDIEIIGDMYFYENDAAHITISENTDLTIQGNVNADVYTTILDESGMTIKSGANVKVLGDFIVKSTSKCTFVMGLSGTLVVNGDLTATTALEINQNEGSYLKICGNFTRGKAVGSFNAGVLEVQGNYNGKIVGSGTHLVILSGSTLQNIDNLKAQNLHIENTSTEGVNFTGTSYIYGEIKNENTPLNNGKSIHLYGGTIGGTRYIGDIRIERYVSIKNDIEIIGDMYFYENDAAHITISENTDLTIQGNVNADVYTTILDESGMTIKSGANVKVLGDFIVKSTSKCTFVMGLSGTLVVNGDLTATTALEINQNEGSYLKLCGNFTRGKAVGSFNAGVLEVQGDSDARISGGSKYTVILSGSQLQNISNLTAPTIIINNSKGVKFNSAIKPTTLFNHNGNPFTLYNNGSGSSFADFDYDGLKDNVDPEPTVGNPCTITVATEDTKKGSVSESLDTNGGTTVTVSAEPTFKYDFYCWKDGNGKIVSYNADYSFVVKGSATLTAYFTKRKRNITINTQNGTLTVPSKAEIESTVTVTPVPNEGCIFAADSITVNDEAITGNTFVMPDEDVVVGAQFYVNEHYFALKDVLTEAKAIDRTLYTSATASVLKTAIDNAQNSLVNIISQAESEARIAELEKAINNLILIKGSCGDSLTWCYDEESKTLTVTGTGEMYDYTASDSPWEAFENEITTVVIGRDIASIGNNAFNECGVLTDVHYGYTEENWQTLSIGENNESLTSANISCHTHNFTGTVTTKPTCTQQGVKTFNCDCGDVYTETIDALGHTYSTEWTIDTAVTCTMDGSKSHHCIGCEEKKDVTVIPATGHSYSDWVVDSAVTCTEDGSRSKTCSGCGDVITEAILSTGHNYSNEWTIDFEPTCIKNGYKSHHCTKCDSKIDETVISPLGHSYGDAVIEREPTCTQSGSVREVCFTCNRQNTRTIPALGHSYSENWTIDIEPTCSTTGQKSHHCTRCDVKRDHTVIEATGHNYVTTVEPTHPHTTTQICSFCNDTTTETPYVSDCVDCNFTVVAIDENSYKLVSYIGTGENVVVPAEYNGLPITKIEANCFKGNTSIKTVVVSEGITSMGNAVFYGCTSLESVTIPSTLTSTGNAAFYNCTSLKSVKISDGVKTIDNSAFRSCTALECVIIPESVTSIGSQAFYGFTGTIYCFENSFAHNYSVNNNLNFAFIDDVITATGKSQIDYANFIIKTTVLSCSDVAEILSRSDSARIVVTASCKEDSVELIGTGSIISVYEGDTHLGDYTLVVGGDTNGDSICDALDCFEVERASNGNTELSGVYAMAADSNSDDVVDITDYQAIVNKALAS